MSAAQIRGLYLRLRYDLVYGDLQAQRAMVSLHQGTLAPCQLHIRAGQVAVIA